MITVKHNMITLADDLSWVKNGDWSIQYWANVVLALPHQVIMMTVIGRSSTGLMSCYPYHNKLL